jgi:hypothetical protein
VPGKHFYSSSGSELVPGKLWLPFFVGADLMNLVLAVTFEEKSRTIFPNIYVHCSSYNFGQKVIVLKGTKNDIKHEFKLTTTCS